MSLQFASTCFEDRTGILLLFPGSGESIVVVCVCFHLWVWTKSSTAPTNAVIPICHRPFSATKSGAQLNFLDPALHIQKVYKRWLTVSLPTESGFSGFSVPYRYSLIQRGTLFFFLFFCGWFETVSVVLLCARCQVHGSGTWAEPVKRKTQYTSSAVLQKLSTSRSRVRFLWARGTRM